MKTFSDYINEKQNFIFGGKAGLTGKEYDTEVREEDAPTFDKLKVGDCIYTYDCDDKFNMRNYRKIEIKDIKITNDFVTINDTTNDDDTYDFDIDTVKGEKEVYWTASKTLHGFASTYYMDEKDAKSVASYMHTKQTYIL